MIRLVVRRNNLVLVLHHQPVHCDVHCSPNSVVLGFATPLLCDPRVLHVAYANTPEARQVEAQNRNDPLHTTNCRCVATSPNAPAGTFGRVTAHWPNVLAGTQVSPEKETRRILPFPRYSPSTRFSFRPAHSAGNFSGVIAGSTTSAINSECQAHSEVCQGLRP
jgi:hypothetical protein